MSDYRCVGGQQFYPDTQEISKRKRSFIDSHRCTSNNWYQYAKNHRSEFNSIYDNKCVYCGVSIGIVARSQFEIDHFICRDTRNQDTDKLSNLVLACRKCNNSKRKYIVPISKNQLFHPDNGQLSNFFCRRCDYSIAIQQQHANDNDVVEFYNALKLDSQLRRLDFLLMHVETLIQNTSDKFIRDKLAYVENRLCKYRNSQV